MTVGALEVLMIGFSRRKVTFLFFGLGKGGNVSCTQRLVAPCVGPPQERPVGLFARRTVIPV